MLHENLKTLRKNRGISQEELAARVHVVRQTVSKWEKGLSVPDADALQALAEALEVSPATLLGSGLPEAEEAKPISDVADQLQRINEQLVIRNQRSARRWKTVGIVLLSLLGCYILLLVLGMMMYSVDPRENRVEVVEEVEIIEEHVDSGEEASEEAE